MNRFSIPQEKFELFLVSSTYLVGDYYIQALILVQTKFLNKFIFPS